MGVSSMVKLEEKLAVESREKKLKGVNHLKTNQVNKLVNEELFNFLITNEQDEQRFWNDFFNGDMNRSITKFQRQKVKETIELEERDHVCETHVMMGNEKQALELLFQEPASSCQMDHFREKSHLTNNNVTFKKVFEKKKQNPYMTLPMILKTMDVKSSKIKVDDNFLL
jgi:hypothetical protein